MSLLFVCVALILIIGAILAFVALFGTSHGAASSADTLMRLQRAQAALEQFASVSGRLPCPANPALNPTNAIEGTENRSGNSCPSAQGTIPWRTIGLRADDGLDSWGWKISYRVYVGAAGSLAQDNGASMVQCDTAIDPSWNPGVDANGLCRALGGWHTKDADFYVGLGPPPGKGLIVNDSASALPHTVAYVLVSHGPTGLGSYTVAGVQQRSPQSADEFSNMSAGGPFVAKPANTANLSPDDVNYFDDILVYRDLADLAAKTNLVARNWPDPSGLASVATNAATVAAAVGQTTITPGDLGRQTAFFNGARVNVTSAGAAENLTFGTAASVEGVGGGGGGNTLSSADSEVLHVTFTSPAQIFAVTLNGFGCRMTAGVCTDSDSVQFTFFKDGVQVGSPITRDACNTLNVASYTIDLGASPGGDFDSVDIAPKPTDPSAGVTQLLVGGFANCLEGASACITPADTGSGPSGNHCP